MDVCVSCQWNDVKQVRNPRFLVKWWSGLSDGHTACLSAQGNPIISICLHSNKRSGAADTLTTSVLQEHSSSSSSPPLHFALEWLELCWFIFFSQRLWALHVSWALWCSSSLCHFQINLNLFDSRCIHTYSALTATETTKNWNCGLNIWFTENNIVPSKCNTFESLFLECTFMLFSFLFYAFKVFLALLLLKKSRWSKCLTSMNCCWVGTMQHRLNLSFSRK